MFAAFCLFTSNIVLRQLTGSGLMGAGQSKSDFVNLKSSQCTGVRPEVRLVSTDPQLKAIADYESACESQFITEMMIFTNMPISNEDAVTKATAMASRLREFERFNIKPIVIVEPDSEWGLIDFQEYAQGMYDEWTATYFKQLKVEQISSSQMGTWIPFPEPQQPFWNNNSNPDDFAFSVNRYLKSLKSEYPESKAGILLDSEVGSDNPSQLVAYTRLIEVDLIDRVGLQGFPWHPTDPDDTRLPITDASSFVPAYMLEEIAKSLKTKDVLINTGTYRHKKMQNGGEIAIPTYKRNETLKSIEKEAVLLEKAGYNVTVNLFAENKLETKEAVDWSYWQPGKTGDSTNTALFTSFVASLKTKDINISIYDSRL